MRGRIKGLSARFSRLKSQLSLARITSDGLLHQYDAGSVHWQAGSQHERYESDG